MRATPFVLLGLLVGTAVPARAENGERSVDLGLSLHLVQPFGQACERDGDVEGCSVSAPFVGARLSGHLWPIDVIGVGLAAALSKDMDASGGASDDGLTWDPTDLWLWRLTAELVIDPPLLPAGLWLGLDVGLVVLREVKEFNEGTRIDSASASRSAALFGAALGWDFWLDDALTLTPELRLQVMRLGEPPELRPDVEGKDFGTTPLLELGVRLAALP